MSHVLCALVIPIHYFGMTKETLKVATVAGFGMIIIHRSSQ
jgi:hypothetical protein